MPFQLLGRCSARKAWIFSRKTSASAVYVGCTAGPYGFGQRKKPGYPTVYLPQPYSERIGAKSHCFWVDRPPRGRPLVRPQSAPGRGPRSRERCQPPP